MSLIDFAKIINNLKTVKRTGWVKAGVKDPESVADHAWGLAVLTMVLAKDSNLDHQKLVKMALIHDIAESIVGDIITERGKKIVFDPKKKTEIEKRILGQIFNFDGGEEYTLLWQEAREEKTKEAKFLKQLDKLEMVLQALEYERKTDSKKLDEFWINAQKYLKGSKLEVFFKELLSLRKKYRK